MFLLILTILESLLAGLETRVLSSDLTIQVTEQSASQPLSYTGNVTMLGERFLINAFGAQAAYDGKTLYVYNEDLDEMTLSTPSRAELIDSNPILCARELSKVCNITERDSKNGKETIITLTPKDRSAGISRFVLRVEKETLLPRSIEVTEHKRTTLIRLLHPTYSTTKPDFRIETPQGAYVNDLR